MDDQRLTTPWQHKALTKLMGLNYKICYKKGVENRVADALSRVSNTSQEVLAISTLQSTWLQELVDSYSTDPNTAKLLSTLAVQSPFGHFTLHKGVIRYKGKIGLQAVQLYSTKYCSLSIQAQ